MKRPPAAPRSRPAAQRSRWRWPAAPWSVHDDDRRRPRLRRPARSPSAALALADYLGRVRGVVADPEHIVVTNGYTQGLGVVCHALAAAGARRIALEDPSNPEDGLVAAGAGLKPVPIGVDEAGTRVDELERAHTDAVVVTPAHQHPTGVVLTGERRAALLAWLGASDAIAIEDDYDAEYRYDRAAIGALQGLDPDRVITPARRAKPSRRRFGSAGWSYHPRSCTPSATRNSSPTAVPPVSNSTRSTS